ncbi:hypothetical protein ES703_121282 [subsurface metagenome]
MREALDEGGEGHEHGYGYFLRARLTVIAAAAEAGTQFVSQLLHLFQLGGRHFAGAFKYPDDFLDFMGLFDAGNDDHVRELEEVFESDGGVFQHASGHRLHVDKADVVFFTQGQQFVGRF